MNFFNYFILAYVYIFQVQAPNDQQALQQHLLENGIVLETQGHAHFPLGFPLLCTIV